VPPLESTPVLTWLVQASGARALINQTNARIALDIPRGTTNAALVMKSFVKMRGESGPYYLERVLDQDGEPLGYQRMTGSQLLANPDQEAAFQKLPGSPAIFSFKDAKMAYGKSDNPTAQWLKKCEAFDLVRRIRRGQYQATDSTSVVTP
jgi:hypothetical protein